MYNKLKPCPFCGGKAFFYIIPAHNHNWGGGVIHVGERVFIECSSCTCAMSAETKEQGIAAWNHRAEVKDDE